MRRFWRDHERLQVVGACFASAAPSPSCSSPAALASRRRFARRSAPSRCPRPTGRCAPSSRSPCATRAPCRSTPIRPSSRSSCATTATATKRPGWKRDKHVRDTGPFIGTLKDGKWTGTYFGTHAPVVTWYSPDMVDWLKSNRAEEHGRSARGRARPRRRDHGQGDVPAAGRRLRQRRSAPPDADVGRRHHGARRGRSHDGWFWGWFGWGEKDEWRPDWPAPAGNDYPYMGFGLYCMNCHGSARDNATFASLRNIKGERGDPLVFLSQTFVTAPLFESFHEEIAKGKARDGAAARPALLFAVHALLPAPEQGAADERHRRQHAIGNLRPCLGAGGLAECAIANGDVDAMHRLSQRRRHRPAIRHDRARAGQQDGERLALWDLAHVAEGPCRTRSDLLRAARERGRDLPSGIPAGDRGHLPRLPCGAGPAPVRHRSPRRDRHLPAVRARQSECDPVPGRQRGARARALRGAGARRRLLHHLPQHGARQGGDPRRRNRSRRTPASTRGRNAPIRVSAGWRAPSPAISCSGRPASSTDRSAIPSRSRWSTPPAWCRSTAST